MFLALYMNDLISMFAANAGKKAGEFYTPQAVSKILTQIAIAGQEDKRGLSVYDPVWDPVPFF